jgi:PTS system nitrogen regulatory IIA component
MQLTVREAASYLNVSEATVRRWIAVRGLPAHRVDERLHCNAIELWEWALEQGIPVSRRLFDEAQRRPEPVPRLSALLREGGIHRGLAGGTKREILAATVRALPLPPDVDRDFLTMVLEAREAMGSTGIGDGIAIPHVRNPILLHVERPFVALCLLDHPVDFDAIDAVPVHSLFVLVSADVPSHLRILAQLGHTLRDDVLRRLLRDRAADAAIFERIEALESGRTARSAEKPVSGRRR